METTTRIGILGTGDAGQSLGNAFLALGHPVRMGAREDRNENAVDWATKHPRLASVGTFASAARYGEIVVLAIKGKATEKVLAEVGPEAFAHKVVIDATNPLDYDLPEPTALFVGTTDSLGERVQKLLPKGRVVKAFNSVGAMHFFRPDFAGGPPDMFIAGEETGAKRIVGEICKSFGWGVADLGGIRSSRWLEALCIVWVEYAMTANSANHVFKVLRK